MINPIELEKRLNEIHLAVDVNVKAERLTSYEAFAENILEVDKQLLAPSADTPENVDQLIWCELAIGYNGTIVFFVYKRSPHPTEANFKFK